MVFLFHVPFFCTAAAAAAVTEIFDSLFVNIEFLNSSKYYQSSAKTAWINSTITSHVKYKSSLLYIHCDFDWSRCGF
jgi:Tfp pilus assembly protein PilZ